MLYRLLVIGDVQGVGFRAKVKKRADALQLKGFAHNLQDGNVEICLDGDADKVDQLVDQLKTEFGRAHIRNIQVMQIDDFQVF